MKKIFSLLLLSVILFPSFGQNRTSSCETEKIIYPGANQFELYLPLLKGKRVGIVANQTAVVGKKHVVDHLLEKKVNVVKIFAPEHGFRGDRPDGAKIVSKKDELTGLPVVSLYGSHYKPTADDLKDLDIFIYDIQDVGVRFYTYISTMTYCMEACAENNIPFMVLDRPNPHGYYVDGPVLDMKLKSFVGMHPVPVVYGMTPGEYAQMVNGEKWMKNGIKADLTVVPCKNYTHNSRYQLPIYPSPNLPDMDAVYLYPSIGILESTAVSVGRGTRTPFHLIGHPLYTGGKISFTPVSIKGMSEYPPYEGKICYGFNVREDAKKIKEEGGLPLKWIIQMYNGLKNKTTYFYSGFKTSIGNTLVQQQIQNGMSEEAIKKQWKPGIDNFKKIRKKYLLYPDFE